MNLSKIKIVRLIILHGYFDIIYDKFKGRIYNDLPYYYLRRDLQIPLDTPNAKIPLSVRELQEDDIPKLLALDTNGISSDGFKDRLRRLQIINANLAKCYVAVTQDNFPCYMQCLLGNSENEKIQNFFQGSMPLLAPDEMILEGAFMHEKYRGQKIMPAAMAKIAEKGRDFGARWIYTFVDFDNIASLKGCKGAGFFPYMVRKDKWRLFRRQCTFEKLPGGTRYPFEKH